MAPYPSPRKVNLVGSRIRELRKGRHLTQTELSEKIGEFFEESETAGPADRQLVTEYRGLSEEARQEVRDFVRFKKMLEEAREEPGEPSGEEKE